MRKSKRWIALLLLLALLSAAGCGVAPSTPPEGGADPLPEAPAEQAETPPAESQGAAWPCTFTDSTGQEVTLAAPPETVAVLFSSLAEVWTLAGGTVDVTVGESVQRGFASAEAALVDEKAGKSINTELLLASQPDLVIGSADIQAQVEACALAAEAGIPAALFRVDDLDQYLELLSVCTQLTGDTEAYRRCGQDVREAADRVLAAVEDHLAAGGERRDILFIRAGSQYSATKAKRAPDHFACVMLEELGANNIADEAEVLLDGLSLEEILLRDPDYIFLTAMGSEEAARNYIGELFAQEGWRDLTAVQEENWTFLPKELFHFKPNARWAEAYGFLAERLYPGLVLNG